MPAEYANTLTCNDAGLANRQTHLLVQGGQLRTLTLTEWERLQCLPDGHTAVAGVTDSARGDMLGNAMHVGMAEWLGRQIVAVDAALPLITPRPALELA